MPTVTDVHRLRIIDATGDTNLDWDPKDKASVAKAEKRFNELLKQGYTAYTVVTETVKKEGKLVKKFNPKLGEIILRPAMAGG